MTDMQKLLTKAFMPSPMITVTVYTVGGTDDDGNEVDEPVVFEGNYNEAVKFFNNENNLFKIDRIYHDMPDGYMMVEARRYSREVYDVFEIMNTIEDMIY